MTTISVDTSIRDLSNVKEYPSDIFDIRKNKLFKQRVKDIAKSICEDKIYEKMPYGIIFQTKKIVNTILKEYVLVYTNGEYVTSENVEYLEAGVKLFIQTNRISMIPDVVAQSVCASKK